MRICRLILALFIAIATAFCNAAIATAADDAAAAGMKIFNDSVKAILTKHCLDCHGGKSTKGDFNLSTRESLLDSGMVEPGDPTASYLLDLVRHDVEPFMPLKGQRLTNEQIQQLTRWIELGASYDGPLGGENRQADGAMEVNAEDRQAWAFRRLPDVDPPQLPDDSWSRTPIDRFVLQALRHQELTPAAQADRRTLIRRLYFDVIGLPPTPAEVKGFVEDEAPDAYEKLVDRLLANPHFGERWARHWLDVVRFAESHGFEHDHNRDSAYHYRDFVIKAFNDDLPYDTFVHWQLAGDEFEPDNPMAVIATGFLAAGVHNTQITANQVEKERYDELDDIVGTIGTSMLGLTVGCARCHDHKYDPIPTTDYYQMVANFTTTVRSETDLELNAEQHRAARQDYEARLAPLKQARDTYEKEQLPEKVKEWASSVDNIEQFLRTPHWAALKPLEYRSTGYKDIRGATLVPLEDDSLLATGPSPIEDEYIVVARTTIGRLKAIRLEALTHDSLPKNGPGRAANGNFAVSNLRVMARPLSSGNPQEVELRDPRATFEQNAGSLSVAAAIDQDGASGWAIDHGGVGDDQAAVFEFARPVEFEGGVELTIQIKFKSNANHGLGRFRFAAADSVPRGILEPGVPQEAIEAAMELTATDDLPADASLPRAPTAQQLKALARWRRTTDATWRDLNGKVEELARMAPARQMARVLYCSEGVPPLRLSTQGVDFFETSYELERGDPSRKVRKAQPGFLQIATLPAADESQWRLDPPAESRTSYRRRSLANWMTDERQGAGHLLARVIVNRLWQHHFGRGLVTTPSDFGLQGEAATHSELIDWLAGELIRGGWRLKPIHRLILCSATYMQDSQYDAAKGAVDPTNQWLWRYAPRRLDAEVIRDSMLSVSGMLDASMFGSGHMEPDHRRRSIYFFLKRSQMPRMMQQFDCPDGLSALAVRSTTTVAPQSLLLMNNDHVQSWAYAFASRVLSDGSSTNEAVVDNGYLWALGRMPTTFETERSVEFLRNQETSYVNDGVDKARQYAVADFCHALFCLNEFAYVE